LGGCRDDLSDDLVAGDDLLVERGEFTFGDVEVSTADSARQDAEEDLVFGGSGDGDVFDLQRAVCDGLGSGEDCGFHDDIILGFRARAGFVAAQANSRFLDCEGHSLCE
jgi:hypothetical protein